MSEMMLAPVNNVDYSLATAILAASDLQVPRAYSVTSLAAYQGMPLELIYKLLQRFRDMRMWITVCMFRQRPPTDLHLGEFWTRSLPHQWEYNLLAQWPNGLHNSLLRLARRLWRKDRSMFISFHRDALVGHALQHLVGNDVLAPENDLLRRAVGQLIDRERAPLRLHNIVIFNPRLSVEQRHRKLYLFRDWWIKHCSSKGQSFEGTPAFLNFPSSRMIAEETVVDTINVLIQVAESEAELPHAVGARLEVNGLRHIEVDEDAGTFLGVLSTALLKVPHAHLLSLIRELGPIREA